MIKSMTGFGRAESSEGNHRFAVELKSVNHRYFEPNIKLPRSVSLFESSVRTTLKQYMERGKVDVFITYEDLSDEKTMLHCNMELAEQYLNYYKQMAERFGLDNDLHLSSLGRCPEVFTLEQAKEDEDYIWSGLEKTLKAALEQFVETRTKEGENLKKNLLEKLSELYTMVDRVEERYPAIVEAYTKRIQDKVAELVGNEQVDPQHLAEQIVLFSDKICTDEETVRLKSHIKAMISALESGGTIGRKLDFIAQEMNREANTIASKANDLETSNIAIDLKTQIEKIREQIQNIE